MESSEKEATTGRMLMASPSLPRLAPRPQPAARNSHSRWPSAKTVTFKVGITPVSADMHRGCNRVAYDFTERRSNHLYSIAATTNTAGSVVERYSYNAYGVRTVKNSAGATLAKSAVGQDRGFTGYKLDSETGLYYARARMYSAKLGRFISRDFGGIYPNPEIKVSGISEIQIAMAVIQERIERAKSAISTSVYDTSTDALTEISNLKKEYSRLRRSIYPVKSIRPGDYIDGYDLYQAYFVPNMADPTGLDTVAVWHSNCGKLPTAEKRCACHCVYAPDSADCEAACLDCGKGKKMSLNELCLCACKASGSKEEDCEKACEFCKEKKK